MKLDTDEKDMRFFATEMDIYLLKEYWTDTGTGRSGAWFSLGGVKIMTPVTLLDLPIALILDIVQYPSDAKKYRTINRAEEFWRNSFSNGVFSAGDPSLHFIGHTYWLIDELIKRNKGKVEDAIIDRVFELSMSNKVAGLLIALSDYPYISEMQCQALYQWQKFRPPNDSYTLGIQRNLARNPNTPPDLLRLLASSQDDSTRITVVDSGRLPLNMVTNILEEFVASGESGLQDYVANHSATSPELLSCLATNKEWKIQTAVANNPNTTAEVLTMLAKSKFSDARAAVAANPLTPWDTVLSLAADTDPAVRAVIARHPKTPTEILIQYAGDKDFDTLKNLIHNPSTPREVLEKLTTNYYVLIQNEARDELSK